MSLTEDPRRRRHDARVLVLSADVDQGHVLYATMYGVLISSTVGSP